MKTNRVVVVPNLILLTLSLCLAAPGLRAQTNLAGLTPRQIAANQASLTASDSPDQPIGPNHRTTRVGTHKIAELATGLNFWDGARWSPSEPGFVADPDGFYAGKTQHQVYLAANLGTSNAVTVLTPEGLELNSTPVAIALYDAASGNFSVIASITNCAGELLSSNQVIYPDAFSGGVCADVVYTITAGSFHQDVVFTGSLDPAAYGFPDDTTRIQIITEFYAPPTPEVTTNLVSTESGAKGKKAMASPDLVDEELGFGRFVMTRGRAYTAPSAEITNGVDAPVAKEFVNANGTHLLVESVPYTAIAAGLAALPPCHSTFGLTQPQPGPLYAGIPHPGLGSASAPGAAADALVRRRARFARAGTGLYASLPQPGLGSAPAPGTGADALARRSTFEHGVVIDYVANIGGTMSGVTTFQADTTYLVSGAVVCNGGAIIEGGAVFKYKMSGFSPSLTLGGSLTFKTGQYRPVVFTAVDDDSIGDTMRGIANSAYTGIISGRYYASPALVLPPNFNASGLRFCYAKTAVQTTVTSSGTGTLANDQFVHCLTGLLVNGDGGATPVNYNIENSLFTGVSVPFAAVNTGLNVSPSSPTADAIRAKTSGSGSSGGSTSFNPYINIYNTTVDLAPQLGSITGNGYLFLTAYNSIFADVTNLEAGASPSQAGYLELGGTNNGFFNDGGTPFGGLQNSVSTTPFQTVGAGNYYLTSASGFQTLGLTNKLPANVAAILALRTTYPPLVTNSVTETAVNWVLNPVVPRDTAVQSLGYHYDPLDYAFGSVYLVNSTVTVTNGAAIATFGTNGSFYGLGIGSGSSFTSFGAPNNPDWLALYNTVMEGTNNWSRPTNSVTGELYGATPPPTIYTRFTSWSVPANDVPQFYAPANTGPLCFQDNEFHGGKLISTGPTIDLTNCLLERVYASLASTDGLAPWIQNCTFRGGTFNFAPTVSTATVENNLFDTTNIPNNSVVYTGGYNAYISSVFHLAAATGDQTLSASPAYQTGTLGKYYLPAGSPLLNGGNPAANLLGLYEYTTQTNQTKETNSAVDIGYHYVATDGYGNPLDTLWYGIPDYLADTNGSGSLETWELTYFGQLGLNPTASDDGQGGSLLSDFQNDIYPNVLSFTVAVTNNYTAVAAPPMQLNLSSGIPSYQAIVVDDPNYLADAVWQTYTGPIISKNLGATPGWHGIWIGLKGAAANAPAAWQWKRMKLDTTSPLLVITNPLPGSVSFPTIQIQGYCPEALGHVTYDLANSLGLFTNEPVVVIDQTYSTDTSEYTTNTFQAFDVPLTNGVNVVTFHATDLAGNATNFSVSYTLDYSAKPPPVVQLYWPQNGTMVCNSSYTWRGRVSDPTAAITAETVDIYGDTNIVSGIVERNGDFWVENIAMTNGVNSLTLIATDAAGNVTTTNIAINSSTLAFTITPPSPDQLWNQTIAVSGTISDPSDYTIWVNGTNATISGNTWTASAVYLTTDGVAVIQARAIPNSDHGGNGTGGSGSGPVTEANLGNPKSASAQDAEHQQNKPPRLYILNDTLSGGDTVNDLWQQLDGPDWQQGLDHATWNYSITDNKISFGFGHQDGTGTGYQTTPTHSELDMAAEWQASDLSVPNPVLPTPSWTVTDAENIIDTNVFFEFPFFMGHFSDYASVWTGEEPESDWLFTTTNNWYFYGNTVMKLQTGGKGTSQKQSLFRLSGSATQYWLGTNNFFGFNPFENGIDNSSDIPLPSIMILNQKLGSDGSLWIVLPDNSPPIDVTPQVHNVDYYTFTENQQKYSVNINAAGDDLDQDVVNDNAHFCVGQDIPFLLDPLPPGVTASGFKWTLPGNYVNDYTPAPNAISSDLHWFNSSLLQDAEQTNDWYVDGGIGAPEKMEACVDCTLSFNNGNPPQQYSTDGWFTMLKPKTSWTAYVRALVTCDANFYFPAVHFGNAPSHSGINFISTENDSLGIYSVVQLIDSSVIENCQTDGVSIHLSCSGKDGNNFVPYQTGPDTAFYWDSPGAAYHPQDNKVSDQSSYRIFLMFQPPGGISVPLKLISWNWTGAATLGTGGAWNLSSSSAAEITSNNKDTDTFPTWTNFVAYPTGYSFLTNNTCN